MREVIQLVKRKTIYDIANELSLAPGTISKVLNQTGNVSEKLENACLHILKK